MVSAGHKKVFKSPFQKLRPKKVLNQSRESYIYKVVEWNVADRAKNKSLPLCFYLVFYKYLSIHKSEYIYFRSKGMQICFPSEFFWAQCFIFILVLANQLYTIAIWTSLTFFWYNTLLPDFTFEAKIIYEAALKRLKSAIEINLSCNELNWQ